jgi:DNA repair protein RadC
MFVDTAQAAVELLTPFYAALVREAIVVIHLDDERNILAMTIERPGGSEEVELPIRTILEKALRLGATGIIVSHNHPSGDPRPSAADESATRALAAAAVGVGIRLHDHLVFGGGDCRSFRNLGLL